LNEQLYCPLEVLQNELWQQRARSATGNEIGNPFNT
jgi:hypothetical protein